MADNDKEAKVPTSRIARTAKFGGMVAGQSARWAGTRAANRLRSDEKADEGQAKGLLERLVEGLDAVADGGGA